MTDTKNQKQKNNICVICEDPNAPFKTSEGYVCGSTRCRAEINNLKNKRLEQPK